MRIVDGGLTLLEFPPLGYGNFTSVFVNETSAGEKVFLAVHSHHFATVPPYRVMISLGIWLL